MPPVHRNTDGRFCGAKTNVTEQSTAYVNNKLAAVEGDRDDHNNQGNLIQSYGDGSIFIENKKLIVAMGDKAMPDSQGLMQHPIAPTDPKEGSDDTIAYGGKAGGGQGTGGKLNIGEIVKVGGQVMGMVKNFTSSGGGGGSVVLQNMGNTPPTAGQTLVGDDSGNSFTLSSFEESEDYDTEDTAPDYEASMENVLLDDYGAIAMPEYFTGLPSQDYQTENLVAL